MRQILQSHHPFGESWKVAELQVDLLYAVFLNLLVTEQVVVDLTKTVVECDRHYTLDFGKNDFHAMKNFARLKLDDEK